MLSSSFNFPFIALIFFDSTTTNSFYSANFNFSPTLIIPLTPNLHKNEINRRLLYSLTSSCLFSTCTKKLYKSCTTVSRGGTLPLSMQFLSVRRSSIPVCGSRNENKGYTKGGKVQENQGFPPFPFVGDRQGNEAILPLFCPSP